MAKPDLEKGYTKLAHELLDQICRYKFNGSQFRIIIKLWRMTYGFHRKGHEFSRSFIQKTTGLSASTVKTEVASLIHHRVLLVVEPETRTEPRKLAFNKDYDQWTIPKCGDDMTNQMDLFEQEEGGNSTPPQDEGGGVEFHLTEGYDSTPQVVTGRGTIPPPYKDNLLKISIKDKESYFESFYEAYPRKISRAAAEKAWKKLCKEKDFDPAIAIQNTMNFKQTCKEIGTETRFIPHPSTFLNQKRYEDYQVIDPEGLAGSGVKESKFGSNFDFLKQQIGGAEPDEQERDRLTLGEGNGSIPE